MIKLRGLSAARLKLDTGKTIRRMSRCGNEKSQAASNENVPSRYILGVVLIMVCIIQSRGHVRF